MMGKSGSLVSALGALLVSTSLAAQDPPRPAIPTLLEGLTLDAQSGLPFPNVQLRFDTGERVTSDDAGRYFLEGVDPGYHRIALVTGRCSVTFADLELAEAEIKQVAFQIPSEMVGIGPSHEELKKRSEGAYYSAAELQEMSSRTLLDVIRRVAPEMVGPQNGLPGAMPSLMGRTRTAQGNTEPVVVFDEVVVGDGVRALGDMRPSEVYSLEILKGATRGWQYGTGGTGGVIKVVTTPGNLGHSVSPPDRCDIGDWTGRTETPD